MALTLSKSDKEKLEIYPLLPKLIEIINKSEQNSCNLQHASNLLKKIRSTKEKEKISALSAILPIYIEYHTNQVNIVNFSKDCWDKKDLSQQYKNNLGCRVDLLENYYKDFEKLQLHKHFPSQGKFRSTILEEFMYYVFKDFVKTIKSIYNDKFGSEGVIFNGGSKSYTNMYIAPTDIEDFIKHPQMGINDKDQDYAIYRTIKINIEGDKEQKEANIPILAIENKTYLDKTMLEGAIATADKVKTGNPYALYLVVTETYDVDLNVDPIYSRIDQIYVLRKCKREKNNLSPAKIDKELVVRMFEKVSNHMRRPWSKIKERLEVNGEIIF